MSFMPDNTPGGAPAPGQPEPVKIPMAEDLDLSKFFGPEIPDQEAPAAPVPDQIPPVEAAPDQIPPTPVAEAESEIARALREMREDRAARDKVKEEAQGWKAKYEALQAETESKSRAPTFEDDPVGYARSRKWTPEQQSEIVQMLAYDLAPEKAPMDFRFRVMESKQQAKDRAAQEAREAEAARAAQAAAVQALNDYVLELDASASSFTPGAYPANEDWYGDNRRAYVTDLYNLANELAEEAQAQGRRADVSAATLAATLEKKNAERLAALESRRSKRKPPAAPAQSPAGTTQRTGNPVSTSGLREGGPRPPALTEEERLKRATEVAFSTR